MEERKGKEEEETGLVSNNQHERNAKGFRFVLSPK